MTKFKIYFPYVLILILILILFSKCSTLEYELKQQADSFAYKEQMYSNNKETLTKKILEDSSTITTQKLLIVTKEEANKLLVIENKNLKKIKSEVRVVTKTEIKNVMIPYEVLVREEGTIYDTNEVAKIFRVENEWYGIDGEVLTEGVFINSIKFRNELVVTIGEKDNGFFKKDIPVVEVHNKNPFSNTDKIYNVVLKSEPKRFYEKKAFQVGFGVVFGAYLGIKIIK